MSDRDRRSPALAVLGNDGDERADHLARALGLPRLSAPDPGVSHVLAWSGDRWQLRWNRPGSPGPVEVDLVAGPAARRWQPGVALRRSPLARAVGVRSGVTTVLDATAGLGRDAFLLACCGCRVRAIERSPVIAALLDDGLRRAAADPRLREAVGRVDLVRGDATEILASLPDDKCPDAVYLDPMFGARTKSARVKKEMQLFAELDLETADPSALLAAAQRVARRRTVVKRPAHAAPLAPAPDTVVTGRSVRWDVYLTPGQ